MSKASVAMRVCCDCYGIEEEREMYRCAKCGKFMCAECNCKCAVPEKEPAGEIDLAASTLAGRAVRCMTAAISRLFS
jgi:hypothetical protein